MSSEAILNGTDLNNVPFRTVTQAQASARQNNLWQRARSLFERVLCLSKHAPRRLRLCESLPLGERRFVAVIEFESARFLVGGTSASLVLLARLQDVGTEVTLPHPDPTEISAGAPR